MAELPSIGVRIDRALVSYTPQRILFLYFTPGDALDWAGMQSLRHGQKGEWAQMQMAKADAKKEYHIASRDHPLRGFGVGVLPEYEGKILLVAKEEKNGTKITAASGHTSSVKELEHPLIGAAREFAEEIYFSKEETLYFPRHAEVHTVDALVKKRSLDALCENTLLSRMDSYPGIKNAQSDSLHVEFSTKNILSEYLGLDRIVFFNSKNGEQREFNGWFYWDPDTAGVNILFYAKIATDGTPFNEELAYGTQQIDESQRVVGLNPKELLSLGEPRTLEATVYDGKQSLLKTAPGGMNRAIARWHR